MTSATQRSIFILCSTGYTGLLTLMLWPRAAHSDGCLSHYDSCYFFTEIIILVPRCCVAFYCLSVCCVCSSSSNSGSHDIFIKTFLQLRFLLYSLLHATQRRLPFATCHWHFNVAVTAMAIATFDMRLRLLLLL